MGTPYIGNAATFLIQTAFWFYILLVMVRFLLQLVRADFYNPVSQFIVKATNPPLKPLRRMIPGLYKVDTASIVLMFVLKYIELTLISAILGHPGSAAGLAVLSIAGLLSLMVNVFLFAIIIQVVISWINPGVYNPIIVLLHSLTEPLLWPARRVISPAAGLDLSPIIVIVVLTLISMLVVAPINDIGRGLLV